MIMFLHVKEQKVFSFVLFTVYYSSCSFIYEKTSVEENNFPINIIKLILLLE